MFCPKCGTKNPDDGRFCRSCGADLGNVSAALTGNLPKPQAMLDRKGRPVSYESAVVKIFSGLAFLAVAIALGISTMGRGWWFWFLIPAIGGIGKGVAQYVQLKHSASQGISFVTQNSRNTISSPPPKNSLPATPPDYVAPPKQSIYDTGDLEERPGSVTEGTTRHLQMDSEGETMTLPKK